MPPNLPIVIERSMGLDLLFGTILAVLSFALGWRAIRGLADEEKAGALPALLLAAFGLVLGAAIAIRDVGWQFRIEKDGIALHAPFDVTASSTTIAWRDLDSVWVSAGGYRSLSYKLHHRGRQGQEIVLQNAHLLPGRLLQDVFVANATATQGTASIAAQLEDAAKTAPWSLSPGYRISQPNR